MREIKFRAWDTETKKMSYNFLNKHWLRVCIESPYVELMQYTGLQDKNGREIYEGDIVHYVYEPGEGFWNANQIAEIVSEPCGLKFGRIVKNKYAKMVGYLVSIPNGNGELFEVIGNIYENPELLEVTP